MSYTSTCLITYIFYTKIHKNAGGGGGGSDKSVHRFGGGSEKNEHAWYI
jgi:hypothetical protein